MAPDITTWSTLPERVREVICMALLRHGDQPLSRLVTVCRDFQRRLEPFNFMRIKLTPERLGDFADMTLRTSSWIRYIWFCIEIDEYECWDCIPSPNGDCVSGHQEEFSIDYTCTGECIDEAFRTLFSVISEWDETRSLTLDISIYSPSDSEHWFKYLTPVPDEPLDWRGGRGFGGQDEKTAHEIVAKYHDSAHGWEHGVRELGPPRDGIIKVFRPILSEAPFDSNNHCEWWSPEWWNELPRAPVVTSVYLRQQSRRRWNPADIANMVGRFPRLEELYYEPWREWDRCQRFTDIQYQYLFERMERVNYHLKKLVVFENWNQQYPKILRQFDQGHEVHGCDVFRVPNQALASVALKTSLELEHFAASFIIDAEHFFSRAPLSQQWPNLRSVVLTSQTLVPGKRDDAPRDLLIVAARAAKRMPRLESMEIWNGRKGTAALFQYHVVRDEQRAVFTWRATWAFWFGKPLTDIWKDTARSHVVTPLEFRSEIRRDAIVNSHVDAIHELEIGGELMRPVSLERLQIEDLAMKGMRTVDESGTTNTLP